MTRWFSRLTLNQRLAVIALLLGAVAVVASPTPGASVTINAQELAVIVAREVDHVDVRDLADWIIQGRSDYRLVDLRDAQAYAAYHIPTAESIPLPRLLGGTLRPNEKIVLYSDGGIHSAQGWFLLRAHRYRGVYILRGGLDEWKDQILFPRLPEQPTSAEAAQIEKIRAVSAWFGGKPLSGAEASAGAQLPLPAVAVPSAPAGSRPPAKKRREGC